MLGSHGQLTISVSPLNGAAVRVTRHTSARPATSAAAYRRIDSQP